MAPGVMSVRDGSGRSSIGRVECLGSGSPAATGSVLIAGFGGLRCGRREVIVRPEEGPGRLLTDDIWAFATRAPRQGDVLPTIPSRFACSAERSRPCSPAES